MVGVQGPDDVAYILIFSIDLVTCALSYLKTETTIVGLIFENGVILGADTRATKGPIAADKNCENIHYMAPNIYCCEARTVADTEAVTDNISSQLKMDRYHIGRESRVVTALTLLKSHHFCYHGHVSAALVFGGVDVTGPHLHTVSYFIFVQDQLISMLYISCISFTNDLTHICISFKHLVFITLI
ncbi:putative proteasome endopeptidase complex [Helianthus annuus]|nr:putative proteasome endopeptidase complex [Helianthus annuus]